MYTYIVRLLSRSGAPFNYFHIFAANQINLASMLRWIPEYLCQYFLESVGNCNCLFVCQEGCPMCKRKLDCLAQHSQVHCDWKLRSALY